MSIFPATDIIADVARAADPHKRDVALKRLADLGGMVGGGAHFSTALNQTSAPRNASTGPHLGSGSFRMRPLPARTPAEIAAEKFEAMILQSWLEVLLPKEGGSAFGHAAGSGVWRSMMAEQLGARIAHAGGVGLQPLIAKQARSASSAAPSVGAG